MATVLVVALLIVLVTGGSVSRLARMPFHAFWLLFLALGIQIALEYVSIPKDRIDTVGFGILMASYALILAFCFVNLRIRGMAVVTIGIAMNALVIGLNQGMPTKDPGKTVHGRVVPAIAVEVKHRPKHSDDLLPWLGDEIVLTDPYDEVISFGDLVLAVGICDVVFWGSRRPKRRRRGRARSSDSAPVEPPPPPAPPPAPASEDTTPEPSPSGVPDMPAPAARQPVPVPEPEPAVPAPVPPAPAADADATLEITIPGSGAAIATVVAAPTLTAPTLTAPEPQVVETPLPEPRAELPVPAPQPEVLVQPLPPAPRLRRTEPVVSANAQADEQPEPPPIEGQREQEIDLRETESPERGELATPSPDTSYVRVVPPPARSRPEAIDLDSYTLPPAEEGEARRRPRQLRPHGTGSRRRFPGTDPGARR
ncbi:MAG: DUF5317 family protein [Acidimicrobiia bacterium]